MRALPVEPKFTASEFCTWCFVDRYSLLRTEWTDIRPFPQFLVCKRRRCTESRTIPPCNHNKSVI